MSKTIEPKPETETTLEATKNSKSRLANISANISLANASMGLWGFYFIAKLGLYWKELIGFHTLANLAFAAFILFPVKSVAWRRVRLLTAVPIAIALLYHDSWLPPISRVISQASQLSGFTPTYLVELAGRFISPPVVAMLLVAGVVYWIISRWVRLDAIVIAVVMGAPWAAYVKNAMPTADDQPKQFAQFEDTDLATRPAPVAQPALHTQSTARPQPAMHTEPTARPQPGLQIQPAVHTQTAQPDQTTQTPLPIETAQNIEPPAGDSTAATAKPDLDKILRNFLAQEATRSVSFPAPKANAVPFDIIFIHICSLSWDDVLAVGLDHHPLWQRFDYLLTRFNSASSYSGPAVVRLLRATCGQPPHANLYSPASDKCYLMGNLKRSGFEPNLALNHNGQYDKFLQTIQTQGRLNVPPMPLDGIAIAQHGFDNSPIYDDLSVLTRWLDNRQKSNSPRVALFYNTISLHDGNHVTGANSKLDSRETYKLRLAKLLDDLDQFMHNLEASGRRAVVAVIPEHGAAFRGDKMQIAGLREIPSPSITLVPVGIKVFGADLQRAGRTLQIDKPTSYLAVSQLVARLIEKPPYAKKTFTPSEYANDLPTTPFVSQNEEAIMVGNMQRYYLLQGSEWIDYTGYIQLSKN